MFDEEECFEDVVNRDLWESNIRRMEKDRQELIERISNERLRRLKALNAERMRQERLKRQRESA